MLSEAQQFWDAIVGKVRKTAQDESKNAFRCERYEVTTAPDGTRIGVTLPMGKNEIFLPYSQEVSEATVGAPVLVVWWGSMSNAKVYFFADGYNGPTAADIDVKYKIYNSVEDVLGANTSGSATISGVWSALPLNSILICPRSDFSASEQPVNAAGEIEMVKAGPNGNLGRVMYYGREESTGDYRMHLTSAGDPDGTWSRIGALGVKTVTVTGNASANTSLNIPVDWGLTQNQSIQSWWIRTVVGSGNTDVITHCDFTTSSIIRARSSSAQTITVTASCLYMEA